MTFSIRISLIAITCLVLGCTSNTPEGPFDCDSTDLSVKVTKVKFEDCGLDNGEITVAAEGGLPPYSYSINEKPPQGSPVFTELMTGYYDIIVEDVHGCSSLVQTLLGSNQTLTARVEVTPTGCGDTNGTITVIATLGEPPYKYQLGENSDYQSSPVYTGVIPGDHSMWVGDSNDCSIGLYFSVPTGVSYKDQVEPIFAASCSTIDCHGGSQDPDLRIFSNIQSNATQIKEFVQSGFMPQNGSLTPEEISLITCWIDDGTPEN